MKLISNYGESKLTQRIYLLPFGYTVVVAKRSRNQKGSEDEQIISSDR